MTRYGAEAVVVVIDGAARRELRHLVHKSKLLDWTRGTGPGAGHAPSDLARSIVGDLVGDPAPSPALYRKVTLALERIPHEGGEILELEILELLKDELRQPPPPF